MNVSTRSTATGTWIARTALADSITVSDELNERSTASFTLVDATGTTHYQRGDNVLIERGASTIFRGFIERATESRLGAGGTREHKIDCVDLHYLADKRVAAKAYTNQTAGAIVLDLLTTYLAAEGITAGAISPGPVVRAIAFNYAPVSDAIQELATRAGFWWQIDVDAQLDFREPIATLAAMAGSESILAGDESVLAGGETAAGTATVADLNVDALADTISVTRHSPSYRNRQWVRGGRDTTAEQVETQFGDGERKAFLVGFPIALEPAVEVDRGSGFVTETVGAAGIQTGQTWTYSYASNSLKQAASGAVLTAAHRLRVTYTGLYDVVARVENTDLQTARALVEGGSGVVENVITNRGSDNRDAAFQLASELIDYYGRAATVVRFVTRATSYYPGMAALVTLPEAGLDEVSGLVTTVEWFSQSDQERAVVTVVIGPMEGSWAQWFGALSRRVDRLAEPGAGEVETVTTMETFSRDWLAADRPNIFTETLVGTAVVGADTFPMFDPSERVTFMAWFYGGVEIGRKALTTQSGTTTLVTTTVLTVNDAVGDIDEIAWFGDWGATATLGSGVEVDRVAFVTTKTEIESVVVEKTDQKWS